MCGRQHPCNYHMKNALLALEALEREGLVNEARWLCGGTTSILCSHSTEEGARQCTLAASQRQYRGSMPGDGAAHV